jgi:hypothetical protein
MCAVRSLPTLSGTVGGPMAIEGLRREIVRDSETLARYADVRDRLAPAAPFPVPMRCHAWGASSCNSLLAPRERWCGVCGFGGATVVGGRPVVSTVLTRNHDATLLRGESTEEGYPRTRPQKRSAARTAQGDVLRCL